MKGKDVTVLLMPLRTMCGGLEKKKKNSDKDCSSEIWKLTPMMTR